MLEYWLALPAAFLIAIFAMVTGGEGAILYVPLFLFMGLDPTSAIGTSFATQLVSKLSGTLGYMREGGIQWKLVSIFVLVGVPGVIIGSYLTYTLKSSMLELAFGALTIFLAIIMLYSLKEGANTRVQIRRRDLLPWLWVPAVAGFLTGIFAIGTGTINLILLERVFKLKIHYAVATVVATLAFTALAGVLIHASSGGIRWDVAPFAMLGVALGAQVGPWLAQRLHSNAIKILFAALTVTVGIIMCGRALGYL